MESDLPLRLKREVADLYVKNRNKLEGVDAVALESFASKVLEMVNRVEKQDSLSHDLDVLKESMAHLKNDSLKLRQAEPDSDDFDFAHNDCKNLINSVKNWLKTEGLLT